jgi:hypothetical protein
MPEQLKQSEVNSKTDPSVSKQFDTEASLETKTKDLYAIVDGLKIGILGTYRPGVGVSSPTQPNPTNPYTKNHITTTPMVQLPPTPINSFNTATAATATEGIPHTTHN